MRDGQHVKRRSLPVRIVKNVVIIVLMLAAAVAVFAVLMLGMVWVGLKLIT